MKDLLSALGERDPGMLAALAETWGLSASIHSKDEIIPLLHRAMLDPQSAEIAWDKLDESNRTAMQLLVSSSGQRMKIAQFERIYGKIRKLGRAQIERERPHQQGQSIAETLFYRGFICQGYDKVDSHLLGFVYVPSEFAKALPLHKTSFEQLEEDAPTAHSPPSPALIDEVRDLTHADTSIIDDMATVLAFLQANSAAIDDAGLADDAINALRPHLLDDDENRFAFLLGIGISANLITSQDGQAHPRRGESRAFLSASRAEQIQHLAQAWLESQSYRELWHISGLYPDDSGWSYNAAAARDSVMNMLAELLPEQGWVSVSDLIELIKDLEPDFQRPDGDYDSWYIRNEDGEFLNGFASWDAVEGSLIEFYLMGPMHWLGLVDIGEDAARLTAYGRAFLEIDDWPRPDEPPHAITVRNDGTMLVSRRVNRFERFQLARFARWEGAGDTYVYRLDADSIQRAIKQGINAQQTQGFIARHMDGKPLPIAIVKLLRGWQDGPRTSVSFEAHIVLRSDSEETLDKIFAMPAFRRHLGARLGPMACVVREEQWRDLREKLADNGIDAEVIGIDAEVIGIDDHDS